MKPVWIWHIFGDALSENDVKMEGLAKRMGRSQSMADRLMSDAIIKTNMFVELMDELGYDVCVVRRSDGKMTNIEVEKHYRRGQRK